MTTMAEPEIIKKRTDYIQWDDYFMGTAILASKRCDLNTHVRLLFITTAFYKSHFICLASGWELHCLLRKNSCRSWSPYIGKRNE